MIESPDRSQPESVYQAVFLRRKDYLAAGLAYRVEFSAELSEWVTNTESPMILGDSSLLEYDAVYAPFPPTIQTTGGAKEPRFFRINVALD